MARTDRHAALPPAPFTVRAFHAGDHRRVVVAGEVDLATSGALADALARTDAGGSRVVVDLESAIFLDLSGLAVLLSAATEAKLRGVAFVLRVRAGASVLRLLEVTGLDRQLTVTAD